jgi:hypothetical protein
MNMNMKMKIAIQRKKKETCECGMIVSHYCMKKHKISARHKNLLEKIQLSVIESTVST